ncbi:MAG: hypothetical protein F4163_07825 [Acidimicrobiaceae bacterium]|nr:hypothetical protein [Acidimicrobiaceae bacterium]
MRFGLSSPTVVMRVRLVGWCGLILCLAPISLLASSPAGAVAGYGDVAEDRYYTEPVQWSVDNDITDISGNCFAPDAPVSRGETAVYFWNAEGQPSAAAHSFRDIRVQAQDDAVSWMAAAGITTGTSQTTFSPDKTLTRAELAAFLYRLAGQPTTGAHPFDDVFRGWQHAPVAWLATTGITTGTSPTTFSPNKTLTRADLLTFLYRYQGEPDVTVDPDSPICDPTSFKAVAAGGLHSCGVRTDDVIACWGDDYWGQTYAPSGVFQLVSTGASHSCAIRTNNTITCWGNNHRGQADAPAGEFLVVSAGASHSCAIGTDDTIACWGDNEHGEADAPAGAYLMVSAGASHSCAIGTDNAIACWGDNRRGQTDAPAGEFLTVSAGYEHSCGLRDDNTIACWGWNAYGQTNAPTGTFQNVTTGTSHSCGLRDDNTIACWGWNAYGQTNAPTGTFQNVTTGAFHSCAMRSDTTIGCWGWNFHGQTNSPARANPAVISG